MKTEIYIFGANHNGGRSVGMQVGGMQVLISPGNSDRNADAHALALVLAERAEVVQAIDAALAAKREELHVARGQLALAMGRIPPKSPVRMMGPGCVRFDESGRLWLLNRRDHGWSSWGVALEGWDDLFRRYNVRVTEHGADESGAWWIVENFQSNERAT